MKTGFLAPINLIKKELTEKELHFIELQNNCCLCNSQLAITITPTSEDSNDSTDSGSQTFEQLKFTTVEEQAVCPVCDIKTRVKIHSVQ